MNEFFLKLCKESLLVFIYLTNFFINFKTSEFFSFDSFLSELQSIIKRSDKLVKFHKIINV